jgi:hypothetical protein
MSKFETVNLGSVSVGDTLPELQIDVSSGLIVTGALACRDFERVHHDKSVAQAAGLPDVFMNILTSQALMTRYATDWSGPEAMVRSIDIKLGAPNIPGMVMAITGEVVAKNEETGVVDLSIVGENNVWGVHMQGTVQLALPGGD